MKFKYSLTNNEYLRYIPNIKTSKYHTLLLSLLKKPLFKSSEAREIGIPPRMLAYFCQKGLIERVSRGLYRVLEASSGIDLNFEELVLTAVGIPHGVICLISALCYYNLTDQIMREYRIAIPNADKSPKRPHYSLYFFLHSSGFS